MKAISSTPDYARSRTCPVSFQNRKHTKRHFRSSLPRLSIFGLAIFFFGGDARLEAKSVTFGFEAEVTVVNGNASGLVEVFPNDVITGSFSYEPAPLGNEGLQNNVLSIDVNGLMLSSQAYELDIQNFSGIVAPAPPADRAVIACSLSGQNVCDPNTVEVNTEWLWEPSIVFTGNIGVLASEELTEGVNWDGFESKIIGLRLENITTADRMTLQATINSIELIPEPTSLLVACSCVMIAVLRRDL